MIFPNEVYCSILIDPRDLGNVIDGKNSIDPRELTVLPDEFHPLSWGVVADVMMEFASARRAARDDGIDGPGWTEHLNDGLSGVVEVLRGHSGWSPEHPLMRTPLIGDGPRDDRLVCRDLDAFADAGELAEENARLYGATSVADFVETVWGCTSLEPVKARHFGVIGFRGLEFSFRDGAETRMRAWQFDACPKVAAALAAALTYRCEKGFYMEAGCAGDQGGVWGLSSTGRSAGRMRSPGSTRNARPTTRARREHVSRCPILLELDGSGNIAFRHPGTVPDRLIDNFIPAMKRCDVSGGGPAPGTEDVPEGATVRATRPGDINISFPALAERARPRRWPRPAGRPPQPVTGCDRSEQRAALCGPTRITIPIHWSHHEHL